MKPALLEYLACPKCGADLRIAQADNPDDVRAGELACTRCALGAPIQHGVPDFTSGMHGIENPDEIARTQENFGYSWNIFAGQERYFDEQFEGWIAPVNMADFAGKVVLEAGCGMARHTEFVARSGAKAIIGVDFSSAVYPAEKRVRSQPNAHIVRADINSLPLKSSFDVAFSVGVLHHLPDPKRGYLSMVSHVKPGGQVIAWVYGAENNDWITKVVSPLRERILSRLPMPAVSALAFGLTAGVLYPALKLVYQPTAEVEPLKPLRKHLFYSNYLGSIAPYSFSHVKHIVFDHLLAPIAFYIPREEIETWAKEASLENPVVRWHNQMSWTLVGTRPPKQAASGKPGRLESVA